MSVYAKPAWHFRLRRKHFRNLQLVLCVWALIICFLWWWLWNSNQQRQMGLEGRWSRWIKPPESIKTFHGVIFSYSFQYKAWQYKIQESLLNNLLCPESYLIHLGTFFNVNSRGYNWEIIVYNCIIINNYNYKKYNYL